MPHPTIAPVSPTGASFLLHRLPFDWIQCGAIRLHRQRRQVFVGRVQLRLRRREFELLEHMMRNPDYCFRRDELLAEVWGIHFDTGTNVVDVQVYALRQKLSTVGAAYVIETVRGVGYRIRS